MKKGIVLILACFMMLVLGGCDSGEHIPLTPEESDAIAQYSAYLIMKYDTRKTHKEKLLDEKQLKDAYKEIAAEEAEENGTLSVTPTPSPTPVPERDLKTPEVDPPEVTPAEPIEIPDEKSGFESLGECFENKFKVSFVKSTIGESYRSELEYFSLNAPEGQKLLVTEFSILNESSKELTFATKDYNVAYKLISDKKTYKPKMSLIANDLLLLEKKLAPGESTSGILVFFIDKDDTPKSVVVTNTDISSDKSFVITLNN